MKTQKSFIKATAAIVVLIVFGLSTSPASWADSRKADEFIRQVGNEAIQALTDQALDDSQRKEKFRKILDRAFRIKLIARFTLGRYWRHATKEQREEYAALFENFVIQAYQARFKDFSGENFTVGTVLDVNAHDKLVNSKLILQDGATIPVRWRVRNRNGFKVIDVMVEGVSMALTQRDEFAAIIQQRGGKVEGLLAALRKKTALN